MIKLDKINKITKNLIPMIGILSVIVFFSCDPDTGVLNNVVDAPPSGTIDAPGGSVLANLSLNNEAFTIEATCNDGELSPLASVTFSITDAAGTEMVNSGAIPITGTEANPTFDVVENTMDTGTYTITMRITDTAGLTTEVTSDFTVALSEFAFNYPILYFRGDPNGWAAGEMELFADNTWRIKGVNFVNDTDGFKIANTDDWSDCDWGADVATAPPHGFDATMVIKCPGGDPNQNFVPGQAGVWDIIFNDETFAAEINPSFDSNEDGIWMRGAFNGWAADAMTLIDDNTWYLEGVVMAAPDLAFKFANTDDWSDCDWGADAAGAAEIGLTGTLVNKCESDNQDAIFDDADGTYNVTFNDATYVVTFEAQ